jgi:Holliday junction resolvase-like predicted endonuclease
LCWVQNPNKIEAIELKLDLMAVQSNMKTDQRHSGLCCWVQNPNKIEAIELKLDLMAVHMKTDQSFIYDKFTAVGIQI